jgi:hypothetical protein
MRAVDGAWVEAARRLSVHELQCSVSGLVAHGVGIDLGGADAIEEAQGKGAGDQRAGSRVVGVQDRRPAVLTEDGVETLRDIAKRAVPTDRLETARAFRSDPPQRACQPYVRVAPDSVVADRTFSA